MINRYTKVLLYGANLWYLSDGMLGPFIAIFTEQVGGGILDISWAYSVYLIVTGLMTIVVGKISDKHKCQEVLMVIGYAINTVFTFGYLLVDSTTTLFLVQAGLGLSSALATPTWSALYSKHENKRSSGYVWGLASGESSLVIAGAIILGGLVLQYYSFSVLFIIMGFIQLAATAYQSKILFIKKKR